jgi:uncharacterized protein
MQESTDRFPRSLKATLVTDLGLYPVVAVMGARQVGKSTLCNELVAELSFTRATLDHRDARELALADPEGFLDQLGDDGAFIDEVQRAPELMLAIKAIVDRDQRPGRYLLSGSNQPRVERAVSDSLLGRAAYRTLRPLTLSELRFDDQHPGWTFLFDNDLERVLGELTRRADASGALDWREVIQSGGGFPRAVAAPPDLKLRVLNDYITVFANRDVRELVAVESSPRLEGFVRLVAARTCHELNASRMSSDLGVPVSTIRRWLEALQRSYLIDLLPPYSRNSGNRVIKAPKIVFVDVALAMAASGDATPNGFHLENLLASDLLVWKDGAAGRNVYHWREASGPEVDFILEERGELLPVEVKATVAAQHDDARHLHTFRAKYVNSPRGLLVTCDPAIRQMGAGIIACPWWSIV